MEVSPLWTNPKKFSYPNLLTMVQLLKLNTGTVGTDRAESDNASPSCYCRRHRALMAELRGGSYGAMCDFSVLHSVWLSRARSRRDATSLSPKNSSSGTALPLGSEILLQPSRLSSLGD